MSSSSRQQPPSIPSTTSLNQSASLRSARRPPPPVNTVITSPPWARDEPPSPTEKADHTIHGAHLLEPRQSDIVSLQSNASNPPSRWWTFTHPRVRDPSLDVDTGPPRPVRRNFRDRSLSWLPTSASSREGASFTRKGKEKETDPGELIPPIRLPSEPSAPYTLAHAVTPGWDIPWSSRLAAQGPLHKHENSYGFENENNEDEESNKDVSLWGKRKRRFRNFILTNTYVPLLFRFINIAFTTAALGMAIRIREIELKHHAMGAVGSSPTVVIIFAPLTLVHVMIAIYLEYFGRPLGLWRTSAKLAHTLSEVLFICAWSAALSLCFDNFFTSLIPCASVSSTAWYNKLPRPPSQIPNSESFIGDRICDSQLSLICLVGVGLAAYCTNLVISLYRVVEKVKYHPSTYPQTA
ncbi:hypothetical protein K443DRAFT_673778 [Laccaria amethystina LaAM-08-1]|uniref:Uncharacterized protein n=1 Tax=Laccaria amethystina LaAM-08-1 TaxID=1095629 RepID=A0A0C9Y9H1_9AGAR|nr:hypothetical protein K443DRAFT_673778 [Laccaria amethystina LaAM-08-1]